MVRFRLLGNVRAVGADGTRMHAIRGKISRGLLTVMLLEGSRRTVSGPQLINTLWDDPPASAPSNLRNHKATLQRVLVAAGLTGRLISDGGYRMLAEPAEVDVLLFRDLARTARDRLRIDDAAGATVLLRAALDLWHGPAGDDLPVTRRLSALAHGLNADRLLAVEDFAQAAIASKGYQEATTELARHVAYHPERERGWVLLAAAQYLLGNPAEAQATVRRAYRALDDELGLDPGLELKATEAAVISHDDRWFERYVRGHR